MTPTRPRDLLAAGLLALLVANILVRMTYGSLPSIPLFAGATLGVLGIAELLGGNSLRARIKRKPGTNPIQPLVAARAVVVAKASAMAGAIVAGAWAGLLAHVLPNSATVTAAASDTASALVGLVSALVLVGGALWLERCCRAPEE
ncbi:DUF3180 domain-containing protein [Pseudonocardia sp. TRM90224]|uniref:DUF3180 domain-containing protein n=1 Tax=Pseudonocardia sp. TRM90224 TaxID=2812678 RepID=UPI001E5D173F|nr:DUF3180 domain-containing protein [Pseudonocardia sp. TRM90224]